MLQSERQRGFQQLPAGTEREREREIKTGTGTNIDSPPHTERGRERSILRDRDPGRSVGLLCLTAKSRSNLLRRPWSLRICTQRDVNSCVDLAQVIAVIGFRRAGTRLYIARSARSAGPERLNRYDSIFSEELSNSRKNSAIMQSKLRQLGAPEASTEVFAGSH